MGETSQIGWTDATWNAVIGCSKVSEGCHNCYAESLALRYKWSEKPWAARYAAENVKLKPGKLLLPLSWKTPKMVFVNSLSDVFHELIPIDYIDKMFAIMALAPQHTFQILTKRPERQQQYMRDAETPLRVWAAIHEMQLPKGDLTQGIGERWQWPLPNVWMGTSIENNRWTQRADILRDTPAAIRFISAEPLLDTVSNLDLTNIDWVIIGGESGPKRRPFNMQWAREIRDLASVTNTAVFMKQVGSFRSGQHSALTETDGTCWSWEQYPNDHVDPVKVHDTSDCDVASIEFKKANPQQEMALT